MQYTLIVERDQATLKDKVREKLDDGWKLRGGIAIAQCLRDATKNHQDNRCTLYAGDLIFAQALIKREDR